jgi:hypothetical protein
VTDEGCRLAAMVTLIAVEQILPRGSVRPDRTKLFLTLCAPGAVTRLHFIGTIARYDFRNVVFEQCRFERVTWAKCRFDETTILKDCQVIGGGPPAHCEGFGSIQLTDCRVDPEADAIFNSVRVKEGRKKYSVDDLRNDLTSVLNKFVIKGGVGLKTISEDNLKKGPISASRYR